MSKRYFINNLDTRIGRALIDELVKEPVDDPVHMCTMRNENVVKPNGIKKILKRAKPKLSRKKMLEECDVYVYSLENTDLSDIKFALDSLDKGVEQQKVLVLVSDVRVWSGSGKKKVLKVSKQQNQEEGEQGEGQAEALEKGSQDQDQKSRAEEHPSEQQGSQADKVAEEENGSEKQDEEPEEDPYIYAQFEEKDYLLRKPLPQHEYIKEAEDLILNFKRQSIKVIVVCAGILYGQGQDIFESLFKAAWLQNPRALPYLGQGDNLIPTIHIADLAKFVIKLAESPPQDKLYFNAFDLTKDRSQKSIIESISRGVGSGLVESVEESEIIKDPDTFKLDIQVIPSSELVGTQQEPVDFQWISKGGLYESVKAVLKQFCIHHNLRPIKILSYVSEQDRRESNYDKIISDIQKQYRIPILRSQQILKYALENLEGEFKLDLEDEYSAILDYLKQRQSRTLDETLKVYYRVLKWRLSRNDCATRGYIFDGEPVFQQQFKQIFLPSKASKLRRKIKRPKPAPIPTNKTIPPQQDSKEDQDKDRQGVEEDVDKNEVEIAQEQAEKQEQQVEQIDNDEAGEEEDKPLKQQFYPESVIVIKDFNIQKQLKFQVVEYLSLNGVEQLIYNSIGKPQLVVSESLRSYIQRNGRPNNYLISKEILKSEHEKYYSNLNDTLYKQKIEEQLKNESNAQVNRQRRQDIASEVYKMIQDEGEFEIKKMPFRNYLMQFVVPTLNQSLLEVSNIIPNDPVELLAEYLYQRSYQS